jgi:hypothetical protein
MLPADDLDGRVDGKPCKGGPAAPPSAADGLDSTCHPAIVCHQEFDSKARLKCNASAHAQAASFRSAVVFGSSLPKIVSYLRQVRAPGLEGYLTITEAARAYERDPASIADAVDHGRLPGTIMREHYAWRRQVRYVPIATLKARFGEFKREPVPAPHEGVVLSSDLLLAIILSATRPGMMPALCWGQFKEKKGYHYLEYLPAQDGKPSQHKNGWDLPYPYLVLITPGLRNIFENRKQQLIRDRVEITSGTRVFQHGRTNSGVDSLFRHPVSNNTASYYLRNSVIPNVDVEKKTMTPQGMRSTFGVWAAEEYTKDDELVELTLGHVIPAIRDNPTNHSYLYAIERLRGRYQMMANWEEFCGIRAEHDDTNVINMRRTK